MYEIKGSWALVWSLPSEKVPAPPSPNWIFELESNFLFFKNSLTEAILSSILPPLSNIIGLALHLVRYKAAKIPAGPKPTITGRKLSLKLVYFILKGALSYLVTCLFFKTLLSKSPSTIKLKT